MDNVNNLIGSINNEINILSREGGTFISSVTLFTGTQTVILTEPSIVNIHSDMKMVARYEHQGNDLIIHMADGSVVICKDYFFEVDGTHSELVFTDDSQGIVHVAFPESQEVGVLIPEYQPIEDISSLYLVAQHSSDYFLPLGVGALAILGTGIAIANSNSKGSFVDISTDEPQPSIPPVPTIVSPFTDSLLNLVESQSDQMISGTTGITGSGQSVTVSIAGNTYVATVDDNGNWSLTLSPSILASLAQGEQSLIVLATNSDGLTGTISTVFLVDTIPPVVTVDPMTPDNIVNLAESHNSIFITGTSEPGASILVSYNNQQYMTKTDAQGIWSIELPPDALSGMSNEIYTLTAVATDSAGNSASASQSVTMALVPPSPTIDLPFDDDILNSNDVNHVQQLRGVTNSYGENQTVVVNIGGLHIDQYAITQRNSSGKWEIRVDPEAGGHTYIAQVDVNGNWVLDLPPEILQQLDNGTTTITVVAADGLGNYGVAPQKNFYVDTIPPILTLDPIAIDNIISGPESLNPLVITGSYADLEIGQPITLVLNGITYTTIADGSGLWSIEIPSIDLIALPQGETDIILSASDLAKNNSTQTKLISVDTQIFLTVAPVAGDDIINAAEAASPIVVRGTADAADSGRIVTVTLDGTSYTTTVQSDGTWSLSIPSADIAALVDGPYDLSVTQSDAAGNSITVDHTITLSVGTANLPTLTILPVSGDGFLNATEASFPLILSGTSTHVEENQMVTLILNGVTYTTMVAADGRWSITVPVIDLNNITDGDYQVTATVSDAAGNPASDSKPLVLITDSASLPTLSVDPVTADDIVSANESQSDLTVSGGSSHLQQGQTVTVTINNIDYTGTAGANGSWSVTVPAADVQALSQGSVAIAVKAQDIAGNPASASDSFMVDTLVNLTVSVVAGDDIINAAEAGAPVVVSGTADVADSGQIVTVTLEGTSYTTTVLSDGRWSLSIPSADISALADGKYTINASLADAVGNTILVEHDITIDVHTNLPALTIDAFTGDNYINALEITQPMTVTGTTHNVEEGQIVTINLNGQNYSATVQEDGTWSLVVPAGDMGALLDRTYTVTGSVSNVVGNSVTILGGLTVDTQIALVIDTVAGDDIIDNTEAASPVTISGTASADDVNATVTITLNGVDYTTRIQAGGLWSVDIPAEDIQALPDGPYTLTASYTDFASNSITVDHNITIDASAPLTLTINDISDNNYINSTEINQDLLISGTSTGVAAGRTVTITFNDIEYTTTVQSDGNWSFTIPALAVGATPDNVYVVSASVTNSSGTEATAEHVVIVDTYIALTIEPLTGDDIINSAELTGPVRIFGIASGDDVSSVITLTMGSFTYTINPNLSGAWSFDLPAADLQSLGSGNFVLHATMGDLSGNTIEIDHHFTINTSTPALAIDPITGDDYINALEVNSPIAIGGSTIGVEAGQTVTITLNNIAYTAVVEADGRWSMNIPIGDIQALSDNAYQITATVSTLGGSEADTSRVLTFMTETVNQPTLSINSVTADNTLSASEITSDLIITGTSTHIHPGLNILVTLNGEIYSGQIGSNGSWQIAVSVAALEALPQGTVAFEVTAQDIAGNSVTKNGNFIVDTSAAKLSTLFSLMATEQNIDSYHLNEDPKTVGENTDVNLNGMNDQTLGYSLIDLIEPTQSGSQTNHSVNSASSGELSPHVSDNTENKDGLHGTLLISAEDEDSGYITLFNTSEEIRNASVQHTVESQSFDVYHSVPLELDNSLVQENIYM